MKKYISIIVGIILASIVIVFYKYLTFYPQQTNLFGKEVDPKNYINNFYVKYFYQKNEDPLYVWSQKGIQNYIDSCNNCLIMPHQQVYADILWLGSIQYIGSVVSSSKAPNLYEMLDNLTNLSKNWDYPYVFGQLLLPMSKTQDKDIPQDKKLQSWKESSELGKKGIKYTCDNKKTKKIFNLSDPEFYQVVNDKGEKREKLKNPCKNYNIASYLGFNYFYYLGDWEKSSKYYKLASFNEEAPSINSSMVAIVKGRMGQHSKSMQLWFSKVLSLQKQLTSTSSTEKVELYKERIKKAYDTALMEYHLYLLNQASNKTKNVQCKHDYDCLVKQGKLKEAINNEINQCKSYSFNQNDIYEKADINSNDQKFQKKAKCFLLSNSLRSGQTNSKNGNLISPKNTKKKKFVYYWDEEKQTWRIKIPAK